MKNTRIIFPLSKILLFSFLFLLITKCTTNFLNLEIILYVFKLSFFFRNENSSNKFSFLFLFCLNSSIIRLTNYNWKHITFSETCTASIPTLMAVHDHKSSENKRESQDPKVDKTLPSHTVLQALHHSIWPFFVSQLLEARKQRFRFNFFFFSLSFFFFNLSHRLSSKRKA